MPRNPTIYSKEFYYYISARSFDQDEFYIPVDEVWEILTTILGKLQKEHELKIAAFVVTRNRYHLLIKIPKEEIHRTMYFFMRKATREIQKKSGRINNIFGGKYKGCLISNVHALPYVFKFVLLKAELPEYPFSTLFCDKETLPFEVERIMPPGLNEHDWIMEGFNPIESKSIERGLHKTEFQFGRDRATGRLVLPEEIAFKSLW